MLVAGPRPIPPTMTTTPLPGLAELRERIDALMARDRQKLVNRLRELERQRDPVRRAALAEQLFGELIPAEARLAARQALVPRLSYPEELPITARRDDLLEVIRDHQVVVVAGETGSGKSTQLPKLCLELGRGVRGLIGHTQPRRVAARTVAERVAHEVGTELGAAVGYTVRFTDRVGDGTLVKVMTDGILLAETQRDRLLERYDTLIIDEAHERSLNIDFLLGYLHQLLPKRPDLKVVITSATIDTERFAAHFGGAPVVEVTGRTYPVEVRYRPFGEEPDDDRDQIGALVDALDELSHEGPGDVLVFLSGEREIHDAADALRRLDLRHTEIVPLYARLSAAEQHRVFEPHTGRRIVLATNVAETSLTVPGVRYVVDAGTARISRYSRRLKVQRLPIEPVSQASANQRAGRCGRVAPGVCIRLYGEEDYLARPEFTEPEILRTNLASVILQMAALGLGDVASFPFVEPPDARAIADGVALLEELGAFTPDESDPKRRLTPLGRRLAELPVDPRLGRMVLEAERHGCVREVLVITAALSIQDVRERPVDKQGEADELHRRFVVEGSDFLALVKLWDHLREQQRALTGNQFRKLCRSEFLNYLRVREWQDLYSQLRQVCSGMGLRLNGEPAHHDHVHQSLLAGLLSHLGMRDGVSREFRGARGARFALGAGSSLARKPPRWVMAAELVETNRLWARVNAAVQPEWAERLGGHLVKRTYGEPVWSAGRGTVTAPERVTLYGLPIVTNRMVNYARVDAGAARAMFLRAALVEGDWETHHRFVERNRRLVEEVKELEERTRRPLSLVDDDALYDFYDKRVPADVTSGRLFDQWWKREKHHKGDLLTLTREHLMRPGTAPVHDADFPATWTVAGVTLPLTYAFEPGSPGDGVTVHVPVALLAGLPPEAFEWQVPGFRAELVTALVRSLPKPVRRHLTPVADTSRLVFGRLEPSEGSLLTALSAELSAVADVRITPGDFAVENLPTHLRVTFVVEGDDGSVLASGTDLAALQARLKPQVRASVAAAAPALERDAMHDWELGELPRVVHTSRAGHDVRGFPALIDNGEAVAVRVLTTEGAQARAMQSGTRRLLALTVAAPRKAVERIVTTEVKLALVRTGWGSVTAFVDECVDCALDHVIRTNGGPAWDHDGFCDLQDAARVELTELVPRVASVGAKVLVTAASALTTMDRLTTPNVQASVADARAHLGRLVRRGFLVGAGFNHLDDLLRYVRAVERRVQRLPAEAAKDRDRTNAILRLEHDYERLEQSRPAWVSPAELGQVAWMLEELRVSLFAQVLGTAFPVSEQRVLKELARLSRPS